MPPQLDHVRLPTSKITVSAELLAKYTRRQPLDFDESIEAAVATIEGVFGVSPGFVPFVRVLGRTGYRHFDVRDTGRPKAQERFWSVDAPQLVRETGANLLTMGGSLILTPEVYAELDLPDAFPSVGMAWVVCVDGYGRHSQAECLVDLRGNVAQRGSTWNRSDLTRQNERPRAEFRAVVAALACNL